MLPRWIVEFASPGKVVITVLLAIAYFFLLTQLTSYKTLKAANNGRLLEETAAGYSSDAVTEQLRNFGDEWRVSYQRVQLLDYLNALLTAFALTLVLTFSLQRVMPRLLVVALLPVLGLAADCAENTLLLALTSSFPNISSSVVWLASWTTQLKFLFVGASLLLALVGLIAVALRALMVNATARP